MQLYVPFFRQRTDYVCGPAFLRMLFASSHSRVADKAMLRAARAQGFACRMSSAAVWGDVMESLKRGMPVLIKYVDPQGPHGGGYRFVLITGVRGGQVRLHDPSNGNECLLGVGAVKKRWIGHCTARSDRGWMMTVRPREVCHVSSAGVSA